MRKKFKLRKPGIGIPASGGVRVKVDGLIRVRENCVLITGMHNSEFKRDKLKAGDVFNSMTSLMWHDIIPTWAREDGIYYERIGNTVSFQLVDAMNARNARNRRRKKMPENVRDFLKRTDKEIRALSKKATFGDPDAPLLVLKKMTEQNEGMKAFGYWYDFKKEKWVDKPPYDPEKAEKAKKQLQRRLRAGDPNAAREFVLAMENNFDTIGHGTRIREVPPRNTRR
jgi:hypothetical protein